MRCPQAALSILALLVSAAVTAPASGGETRRTAIVQAIEKARA